MQHPQPTIGNGGKNVENIAAVEEDESDEATFNVATTEAAGNADEEAGEDNLPPRYVQQISYSVLLQRSAVVNKWPFCSVLLLSNQFAFTSK